MFCENNKLLSGSMIVGEKGKEFYQTPKTDTHAVDSADSLEFRNRY